jgi:anti-sigma-K factor RskA
MDCPIRTHENTDWLLDYSAGRLDRERAALMARHVETCQECARFVEGQQLVWNALSQWEVDPVSAGFDRRLYRAIDAQPVSWKDRLFRPLQPLWRPIIPLAAACLLIAVGVVLHTPQATLATAPSHVAVEKIEAEQVERTLDDMQMLRELEMTPKQEENTSKSL